MSIITLTTDYGLRDHFVGALKGKLLSEYPEANIIDISHEIDHFNTAEASYIVEAAYSSFPKGSVHLIGVDIELGRNTRHVAMQWNGHFFICADNGTLGFLTQKFVAEKIVAINIHDRLPEDATDLDVFAKVACHLAKGGTLNVIGREIESVMEQTELKPVIASDGSSIKGYVVYIDHFGNVVTNITKKMFTETGKGRNYEVTFRTGQHNIRTIFSKYADVVTSDTYPPKFYEGQRLALFNAAGNLEIALFRSNPATTGGASSLLGLGYRDAVTINFS
ncbi:SAM hydrolase/SAM-dependent halogenase family protein [Flavobacterium selenitireducens]|uniref:SAM hydrolase/SAM-dependent halogenase family protein n=1 Tax=Flavobacterium selenitireducens TaxID=2722704 RepID=UPI00168ADD17|nr:SAM-dependent chlorinase/fluorinase [Flavobacterium selenitireducens]MBD3583086.1 SAM-dependent chlorinase/fluorinase [Flavobacterium selenitireducens]